MKKLFLVISVVFTLSSCTVYRTISFNADHSGTMENKVDMTQMVAMMGENGGGGMGMGNMGDMKELEKTKSELEAISGITNVKVSYDTTGIIYSSYNFNSTEALVNASSSGGSVNNVLMGMGEKSNSPKPKITYKGKKFFMEEIDKKTLKTFQDDKYKKDMGEMDMILSSSKMNTTIHFPSAVKKVSYKNASITNDKTVNFEMPFKDLISKDYKPLTVNLK